MEPGRTGLGREAIKTWLLGWNKAIAGWRRSQTKQRYLTGRTLLCLEFWISLFWMLGFCCLNPFNVRIELNKLCFYRYHVFITILHVIPWIFHEPRYQISLNRAIKTNKNFISNLLCSRARSLFSINCNKSNNNIINNVLGLNKDPSDGLNQQDVMLILI